MTGELRFDGQVALVTGAGTGLGRSHARLLAQRGAAVVVNDLDDAVASGTAHQVEAAGGRAMAVSADVADTQEVAELIDRTVAELGRLDIVVNNAGLLHPADFADMTVERFDQALAVNLRSAFLVTRAAWPHMVAAGYGRVVSTTSNSGLLGVAGSTGYAAAKAGIWGFTRSLALEGADLGINVNAIAPIAYTAMSASSRLAPDAWRSGEGDAWSRRLDVAQVSPVVAWLAHDECDLNGEVLSVAGGRVARFTMAVGRGVAIDALTPESVRDNEADIVSIDELEHHATAGGEGRELHRRLLRSGRT